MTPSLKWKGRQEEGRFLDVNASQPESAFRLSGNSTVSEWPDFRGPGRLGVAPDQGVEIDWAKNLVPLWRKPIGAGHSSVVVVQNRIYTLEQIGSFETLTCLSIEDGSVQWQHQREERWSDSMGGIGPRSTPVHSNGSLYYLSSGGKLTSLDAFFGKVIWEQNAIAPDYEYPHWGIACSPLAIGKLVVVSPGGVGAVKAYDAGTGEPRWTSELTGAGVYLSPTTLDLLGEKHLVAAVEGKLAGIDPTTGKTLWEHPWKIFMINALITQPLELADDVFLLSAGYGKGAEAIRIKETSKGFVTENVWKSKNLKTKFSTPVLKEGYLYGLSESSLTCLDSRTGELKWHGKKYGYGRILLAEDKLFVLGNTGMLSIVRATPDSFEEIVSHQILSKERCWNGPALVGGYLVVRNGSEIACYDLAKR